jgi:hypothetical protein
VITGEQAGQWINDGAGWIVWVFAWLVGAIGALCAIVAVVIALVVCVMAAIQARSEHRERQQVAYRDWCESHSWCPTHDQPDGQCPRVEALTIPYVSRVGPAFVECPGSGQLR